GDCGNCDVCISGGGVTGPAVVHPDSTRIAQMILSCVIRLNQRRGAHYTCWVLRADESKQVQLQDYSLSTWGLLKDKSGAQVLQWINDCIHSNLLERSGREYPVLVVTTDGWAILRSQAEARLSAEKAAKERRRGKTKAERVREHG